MSVFDSVIRGIEMYRNSRRKRLIAGALAFAFLMMALSPLFVESQASLPDGLKNGPYVDKIIYNVITQDDQQVLALQNDDIDLIGDMVDPSFLPSLEASDNIEIANVLRNGYGYVTINTAKYPLSETALRRALAFALDKEAISDDVWDGLSQPLDSCVPAVNPWSVEGQLPYTYYEENIPLGNHLLDEAGFVIPEGEVYRRAPNGEEFDILVECASSSNIAIEVGALVAEALQALHINAVSEPTDFYEYLNRLYFHGNYDIVFLGVNFNDFDVDWLAFEFWSEYADEPYFNYPNFRNTSYDLWRENLLHSTDYDEVYEAAIEMQKVWVYQCPQIVCYENIQLSAYRTDKFEGHINDVNDGVPGWWTNYKAHLKVEHGGPFGGTFRWSNPLDINSFNHMVTTSQYAINILQMLYDNLVNLDGDGNDVMWLAESYTAETHEDNPQIPVGYTRFSFTMIQNATWSDGQPLTAEDVAFTLNYYRDAPGNPFAPTLREMTAAYAPTQYQLVVEFSSESYWHLHNIVYKPILPKHYFVEIGLDGWNTWNPRPPTEMMVTSGPFNVSDYVEGEFTEMIWNPNYFFGLEKTTTAMTTPDGSTGGDWTLAVFAGAVAAAVVILVGGYVLLRQK
jgi:ABC-type transport system substrate-binding protein